MSAELERSVTALAEWALPLGTSGFGMKGSAFRGHLAYVERFVPGGHEATLAALPSHPDLRRFFAQPFLAASRYDCIPLALVGIGCARVTRLSFHEFVRVRSGWQAHEDLNGAYRVLLNFASVEQVALRLPKLMAQYFDFAESGEPVLEQSGYVRQPLRAVPLALAAWLDAVAHGYLEGVLSVIGARGVRIVCSTRSAAEGRVDMDVHIRWRL